MVDDPMKKTLLALGFLKGDVVDDWVDVMIRGLLYAKEMTFKERMAQLQVSVTSPGIRRGQIRRTT